MFEIKTLVFFATNMTGDRFEVSLKTSGFVSTNTVGDRPKVLLKTSALSPKTQQEIVPRSH